MKKKYETPKAEKMEFDYIESVVACCSKYPFCFHQTGVIPNPTNAPAKTGGGSDVYNNNPNGQYFKCTCQQQTSHYGAGWGQRC